MKLIEDDFAILEDHECGWKGKQFNLMLNYDSKKECEDVIQHVLSIEEKAELETQLVKILSDHCGEDGDNEGANPRVIWISIEQSWEKSKPYRTVISIMVLFLLTLHMFSFFYLLPKNISDTTHHNNNCHMLSDPSDGKSRCVSF